MKSAGGPYESAAYAVLLPCPNQQGSNPTFLLLWNFGLRLNENIGK